jgi:hypothetical protein
MPALAPRQRELFLPIEPPSVYEKWEDCCGEAPQPAREGACAPQRNQSRPISGLFSPAIADKLVAMPPDSDACAHKFTLIRPQKMRL